MCRPQGLGAGGYQRPPGGGSRLIACPADLPYLPSQALYLNTLPPSTPSSSSIGDLPCLRPFLLLPLLPRRWRAVRFVLRGVGSEVWAIASAQDPSRVTLRLVKIPHCDHYLDSRRTDSSGSLQVKHHNLSEHKEGGRKTVLENNSPK